MRGGVIGQTIRPRLHLDCVDYAARSIRVSISLMTQSKQSPCGKISILPLQ
jgi:hypothetical protein